MSSAREPRWITKAGLLLLHAESLSQFGGSEGLRDEGLLESALARPQQLLAYGDPPPDIAALAAAYGAGLARNHPFVDGNKRAAFVAIGLFLAKNGYGLDAAQDNAYQAMLALADGSMTEAMLAAWVRLYMRPAS